MLQFEFTQAEQEILVDALKDFSDKIETERKRSNRNGNELSQDAVDKLDEFYSDKLASIKRLSDRIDNLNNAVI